MSLPDTIKQAHSELCKQGFSDRVDAAVILGSGLGGFEQRLGKSITVPYEDIPGFPGTTVSGHQGALHYGMIGSHNVLVFSGRFHHYEGHPFERTLLPVRLAGSFNARTLFISNAAGGINYRFHIGDLMLIDDLISLGIRYGSNNHPVLSGYRNDAMVGRVTEIATQLGLHLVRGTYIYAKGPSYETKAEIRAFRTLGGDAVGMSTAPELLETQRLGMQSVGISLITNMAAGVSRKKLAHEEIKEVAANRAKDFARLVETLIQKV